MKIIHVVYSLKMGGAEVLVRQLCRLQRAEGHDVSVCVYEGIGMVGEAIQQDGVQITVLGEAHPLKTMWRYVQIFQEKQPDVVHCHNQAATTHAALAARVAGVRRVITTRHRVDPVETNSLRLERLYSIMGRFCDAVVGICETTCEALRRAPLADAGRIVRVYNGVDAVECVDSVELKEARFYAALHRAGGAGKRSWDTDSGGCAGGGQGAGADVLGSGGWAGAGGTGGAGCGAWGSGPGEVLGAADGYGSVLLSGRCVCDVVDYRGSADVIAAGHEPGGAGDSDRR